MPTAIPQTTLAILSECAPAGSLLMLPGRQLPRADYTAVAKIIELMGGKWNRKAGAMLFPPDVDVKAAVDAVIVAGAIVDPKKEMGFFETPDAIVDELLTHANLRSGLECLEPSAGKGAIAKALRAYGCNVTCCELDQGRADYLKAKGFEVFREDFLMRFCPDKMYDRVVMNPPFARQADIAHVRQAFGHLRFGGRLVSVMSAGVRFRGDKTATEFREWVDGLAGDLFSLPDDSFKESGTGVHTCVVVLDKPKPAS